MKARVICRSSEDNSPGRRWMVGLQDGAQLRLGALLGSQQPVPVAGQRPQLSQDRAWDRQRPPVGVLMAQVSASTNASKMSSLLLAAR
jgi:hypothetical protein